MTETNAPFRHTGKEVLRGSEHYADCVSEEAAEAVTVALNDREVNGGLDCRPNGCDPCTCPDERHA